MTENKKSLIEQAMADFDAIQSNLIVNTENILRSVAKDELSSSLKENVNEADYDEEDVDDELENDVDSTEIGDETESDMDSEETSDLGDETSLDTETEPTMEPEGSEDYAGGEDSEDYTLDMTGSADDEVISVFKKMGENDGVEVVSDKEINITTPDGGEYQIKLGGEAEESIADFDSADDSEEEDIVFEIEMDEDADVIEEDNVRGAGHDKYAGGGSLPTGNIEGQTAPVDSESGDNLDGGFDDKAVKHANAEGPMVMSEEEEEDYGTNAVTGEKLPKPDPITEEEETIEEQIPVGMAQDKRVPATNAKNAGIVGAGADLAKKLAETEAKYKKLLSEAKKLEAENNEFKNAIMTLRKGLGETGLYTRNLSSATKLFLEHATTREEKHDIMRRFDAVKTIKESKELEKTIASELSNRNNLTESVEKKITNNPTSSNSKSLQETYVHPSISRSLELMKINK